MPNEIESDEQFMSRALELARATVSLASPNPQVGCVLVREGVILGEGAHLYDDYDHAEIVALRQAGERAAGATAYVTLEPCSHHGRTGPCANALMQAGVRRVVSATLDPNPAVSGRGLERLRSAGIAVANGVLQQQARQLNQPFARFIRSGRPLVTLKAAVSPDDRIAPAASLRKPSEIHWVTGPEARAEVQRMRHAADAVLTGIGTVLADDPLLTDRSGIVGPGGRSRRRPLLRVVLDAYLRLPLASKLAQSANGDLLVFCGPEAPAQLADQLTQAGIEVVRVAEQGGRLDLEAVLDALGQRKVLSLLLECGSALNGAFLEQGLVDQLVLFCSNAPLGAEAVPFAAGGYTSASLAPKLQGVERTAFGADTRIRGLLRDPWEAIG